MKNAISGASLNASKLSVIPIRQCSFFQCKCWCCMLPQRVLLVLLIHWGFQCAYNLRVVLSVAITVMVEQTQKNISDHACPNLHKDKVEERLGTQYLWSREVEMMVLYAFFIGYGISHIPGGYMADKYGGRWVLFGALASSTVITSLIPLCTQIADYWLIVTLRALTGFVQGPILPCISSMVSHWVPKSERPVLGGIAYAGSNLGTVFGSIFTGVVTKSFGTWHAAFYFWCLWCCVYLVFHLTWLFSYPETNPHITEEEFIYIEKSVVKKMKITVPWKRILKNMPFWANVWGQFGHNYIFFTLTTCLPIFMKEILAYDVETNAVISALPFFVLWVFSLVYSMLAKYIEQLVGRRRFDLFFGPLSNIGAALCILGAMYVGCRPIWVIALYVLAMIIKPFYYCTMAVNVNELSKNFGGILFAISNCISTLGGILGNWLVGRLTADGTLWSWQIVFWICLVVTIVTSIFYMMFVSSHRQQFDVLPEEMLDYTPPPMPRNITPDTSNKN